MLDFFLSDAFLYIMLGLLVIVTIYFGYILLSNVITNAQISRFFSQYGTTSGVVREYEKRDGGVRVMTSPIFMGNTIRFNAVPRHFDAQYYIYLECRNGEKHFCAIYWIPEEDFRAVKKGVSVQIKDEWEAVGYELL